MIKYLVWQEDENIINAKEIAAVDYEDAVETWAKNRDKNNADYFIANGNPVRVYVAEIDDKNSKQLFEVFGYSVPEYEATAV